MRGPNGRVFEFADFTLSTRERLLLCAGQPVPLTGKAFDLLTALVRRSGHLVSKDELLHEVWPDTFVEEVNLTVNISAVRKALGQGCGRMIQTVPKGGYRFVAPVKEAIGTTGLWVSADDAQILARHPTEHADAYRAYLEGRYHWNLRSEDGLKKAMDGFERAAAIDPRFVAAYSGLADSHAASGYLSYVAPTAAFTSARQYALKALELDDSLADAHASLGYVKFYFDWDWRGADAAFRRAIALDPGYAATHQWYSVYLLAAGRTEEALAAILSARRRDPLSIPINTDIGFHYYYTRQYAEAVKQLKSVLEMKSDFPLAHLWLGRSLQELGRFDDALAAFRDVEAKRPDWPVLLAARGFVEGAAGRPAEARRTLAELGRLSRRRFVTSYGVALVHAGLGQNDDAFAWLDSAFDERSHWLVWLRLDPRWDGLRSDPRFAALVDRVGFPQLEG